VTWAFDAMVLLPATRLFAWFLNDGSGVNGGFGHHAVRDRTTRGLTKRATRPGARPGRVANCRGTLDVAGSTSEWERELPLIQEWIDKFGDRLPAALWTELDGLRA
jgi:hypothetical protein